MPLSETRKAKNRDARHRGAFIRKVERDYNIIEKRLDEKQLLSEAFMLGRNKYGNADTIPKEAAI